MKTQHMVQFRIEVADGPQARTFNIHDLGENKYQISSDEAVLGEIFLDGHRHDHCLQPGCQLDMPLLDKIREAIHAARFQ